MTRKDTFTILTLTREDVAMALQAEEDSSYEFDAPDDDYAAMAETLDDDDMERIARKVGDTMMEGGDYWDAIALWYHDLEDA